MRRLGQSPAVVDARRLPSRLRHGVGTGFVLLAAAWAAGTAAAGHVRLKDGTIITGKPVPLQGLGLVKSTDPDEIRLYPVMMIEHQGVVRYFVPRRQVDDVNRDVDLQGTAGFTLHPLKRNQSRVVQAVGAIQSVTPFDKLGQARVTMRAGNRSVEIFVGITEITPKFLKIAGLNYAWEFGIPTQSIPQETLKEIIGQAIKRDQPDQRLAVARFYMEAEMYADAEAELAAIRTEFPELEETVGRVAVELRQLRAENWIAELRLRRAAGQYKLAREGVEVFPTEGINAATLRDVKALGAELDGVEQQIERIRRELGELQAELPADVAQLVAPHRLTIAESLHPSNIDRLAAYQTLSEADDVDARTRLAVALSGWVVGSANATDVLETALSLWTARTLVMQLLRTTFPAEQEQILGELGELEGVGPKQIAQMIPLLPPINEGPPPEWGVPMTIEFPRETGGAARYVVIPPREYHPGRAWPLIVALRAPGASLESAAQFWSGTQERPGQALRHGYFVVAPEYIPADQKKFDSAASSHRVVLDCLYDVRQRFHIDSDRVFLAGHATGGDACFEIAMSHPDLFAGAIPMCGVSDRFCKYYWSNAKSVPFYVLGGELDRDAASVNARELNRMMIAGFDLIYAEYIGHGQQAFQGELPRLFQWMNLKRRAAPLKEIDVKVLRPSDNLWWWWQFDDSPANILFSVWPDDPKVRISPMSATAKITPGNSVLISCGARRHTVFLNPDLIDYDRRVTIRHNGSQRFNEFLKPSIKDMVDDFRIRADRQRIVWNRIEL